MTHPKKPRFTAELFRAELAAGPYAWPGAYPRYFLTQDGAALCFACATNEAALIKAAIRANDNTGGWLVVGVDVNWEDGGLECDDCGQRIEAAYEGEGSEQP